MSAPVTPELPLPEPPVVPDVPAPAAPLVPELPELPDVTPDSVPDMPPEVPLVPVPDVSYMLPPEPVALPLVGVTESVFDPVLVPLPVFPESPQDAIDKATKAPKIIRFINWFF